MGQPLALETMGHLNKHCWPGTMEHDQATIMMNLGEH